MEFEVLKRSHLKRNVIIGVVAVFIISAAILNFTRAKYRVSDSVPIIYSKINYKVPDLNMVSLYIANEEEDYVEVDTIPLSGYTLNTEQSYCGQSNRGEIVKDDSIILTYENGLVNVLGISKKGTKCYLYFDREQTVGEGILSNYTNLLTRSDFSTTVEDTTTGTIYYADTSKGRTYYFAGNPTDNWVQFAGFYWRIIRINENGSVRMIYAGEVSGSTEPATTGTSTQIQTNTFNSSEDNNMYVGYMYQSNQVHGLTTDSTIKKVLDEWYEDNLQVNYAQYLSTEVGFCGDREPSTDKMTSNGLGGTGITQTYYGAYIRLVTNKTPTFDCQNDNDLYTVVSSSQGNKVLDYPIGLITADEVAFAGGVYGISNSGYYLFTNQQYWTMSPYYCWGTGQARVFSVRYDGMLPDNNQVVVERGIRPVINLSPDVTITGSGTTSDPYTVVGT